MTLLTHLESLEGEKRESLEEWLSEASGHALYPIGYYGFLPEDLVDDLTRREWSDFRVLHSSAPEDLETVPIESWENERIKGIAHFLERNQEHEEWSEVMDNLVLFAVKRVDGVIISWRNLNLLRWLLREDDSYWPNRYLTTMEVVPDDVLAEIEEKSLQIKDGAGFMCSHGTYTKVSEREAFIENASREYIDEHNWNVARLAEFDGFSIEPLACPDGWEIVATAAGNAKYILYRGPLGSNSAFIRAPLMAHCDASLYMDGVNNASMLAQVARIVNPDAENALSGRGSAARLDAANIKKTLGWDSEE